MPVLRILHWIVLMRVFHMLTWNSLPDISPAELGSFGISRELQFEVCNYGEPCAGLHTQRKGQHFNEKERELGEQLPLVKKKAHGSSLAESLPGKKRGFSSSSWALLSSQDRRVSPSCLSTLFNWGFCVIIFYILTLKNKITFYFVLEYNQLTTLW